MTKLPRSTPRAEGVDPRAVYDLFRYYDEHQTGVHSVMILRHDRVIAEGWWYPYRPEFLNMLFSMSKSFTSVAVGFAVQEGLLTIQDKLIDFFPDVLPKDAEPCGYMKELTIRDVLRMATGHVIEPSMNEEGKEKWVFQFLSSYIEKKPGSHYLYNTAGTYMLSAVVQKLTGMTVEEYLTPRLFEPLGFGEHRWELSPEGITAGGFGLNLCTEDIAKFGVFLRNRGMYNGKQLLDPKWIDEATAKQMEYTEHMNIDSRQGYGYQFWRCQPKNSYRGAGAFAQFCIVLPDQEIVIAVTSGAQDTQPVLTALWDILLPGVGKEAPQLDDESVTRELTKFLKSLEMPVVHGKKDIIDEKYWTRAYDVSKNVLGLERIEFGSDGENFVRVIINGKESIIPLGFECWKDAVINFPSLSEPQPFRQPVPMDNRISACGAWTGDHTFEMRVIYNQTPFCDFLQFIFDDCGFRLRHQRKTGFHLVDEIYFGLPVTEEVIQEKKAAPKAEFRF